MLRILMILQCDDCQEPYQRITLGRPGDDWQLRSSEIVAQAVEDGWAEVLTEQTNTYGQWCQSCQF